MNELKEFVKEKLKASKGNFIGYLIFTPAVVYTASLMLHPERLIALFGMLITFVFIGLTLKIVWEFITLSDPETHPIYTSLFSDPTKVKHIQVIQILGNSEKPSGFKLNIITDENKTLEWMVSKEEDVIKFLKLLKKYIPSITTN